MKTFILLPLALVALARAQDPPQGQDGQQQQLIARAVLNGTVGITGIITMTFVPGQGMQFEGTIQGLTAYNETGTFPWHVHAHPISADGNCTSALGHLDPLSVSDGLACGPIDKSLHWHCQEGDLSGKHGRLNGTGPGDLAVSFLDEYVRFSPEPFSILGRSIVIHSPINSTRLACGNITSFADGTANEDGSPTFNSSSYQDQLPSAGPPPVVTLTPFVGTSTVESVYSSMFIAQSLPAVSAAADIELSTTVVPTSTINGTTFTSLVVPVANILSTSVAPTSTSEGANVAAALPTQTPVSAPLAPTAGQGQGQSSAGGPTSSMRAGAVPTAMPYVQGAAGVVAAAIGAVALL